MINAAISAAVAGDDLYYAPDPSSQQICSIGGNVAENSGGAHCLKYGFTVHHVTGLEVCTPDGDLITIGAGKAAEAPGYDLTGVFIGSEGTLGIATKVFVRLLRKPEAVITVLAAFATIEQAGATVAAIIAAGLTPAAAEIMDALAITAAEKAVDCGYPAGAGAVLIVEVDGPADEVAAEHDAVDALCRANGAFEVRMAADAAERATLWRGRKSAFAAVGRISPDYIVQDGVVPRTALATMLGEIEAARRRPRRPGGERLPRRRRQPAPARALRRRPARCARSRRARLQHDPRTLRRARRLDHRRARRRRGEGAAHGDHVHRRRPRP